MPRQTSKEYREAIISFLLSRDGKDCGVCGLPLPGDKRSIGIDHKVPVRFGGSNRMDNYRAVHKRCNANFGPNSIGSKGGPRGKWLKILYGHGRFGPSGTYMEK